MTELKCTGAGIVPVQKGRELNAPCQKSSHGGSVLQTHSRGGLVV
jgi:hypothetical protein